VSVERSVIADQKFTGFGWGRDKRFIQKSDRLTGVERVFSYLSQLLALYKTKHRGLMMSSFLTESLSFMALISTTKNPDFNYQQCDLLNIYDIDSNECRVPR